MIPTRGPHAALGARYLDAMRNAANFAFGNRPTKKVTVVNASPTQALAGTPMGVEIARDGKSWVYSVFMVSAELHLVDGLK